MSPICDLESRTNRLHGLPSGRATCSVVRRSGESGFFILCYLFLKLIHTSGTRICAAFKFPLCLEARIGDIRANIQNQLDTMSFAGRLWQIFRAIITGSLHGLQKKLGCSVDSIMQVIDERVSDFFIQSLQLDVFTLQLEYE